MPNIELTEVVLKFDRPVDKKHMDRITNAIARLNLAEIEFPRLQTIYRAFVDDEGRAVMVGEAD